MGNSLDTIARAMATTIQQALVPILEKLKMADHRIGAIEARSQRLGELRERVAVLEARAPVPGPPGQAGSDGLGFDDLAVIYDGQRTIELTFTRGDVVQTFPIVLPVPIYQGTYTDGKSYSVGDELTHDNKVWHCQQPTTLRPGGNAAWKLKHR